MPFITVPDPTATNKRRTLFKYDPQRQVIQIRVRGKDVDVDLTRYQTDAGTGSEPAETKTPPR